MHRMCAGSLQEVHTPVQHHEDDPVVAGAGIAAALSQGVYMRGGCLRGAVDVLPKCGELVLDDAPLLLLLHGRVLTAQGGTEHTQWEMLASRRNTQLRCRHSAAHTNRAPRKHPTNQLNALKTTVQLSTHRHGWFVPVTARRRSLAGPLTAAAADRSAHSCSVKDNNFRRRRTITFYGVPYVPKAIEAGVKEVSTWKLRARDIAGHNTNGLPLYYSTHQQILILNAQVPPFVAETLASVRTTMFGLHPRRGSLTAHVTPRSLLVNTSVAVVITEDGSTTRKQGWYLGKQYARTRSTRTQSTTPVPIPAVWSPSA
jgi:hypothetical protein